MTPNSWWFGLSSSISNVFLGHEHLKLSKLSWQWVELLGPSVDVLSCACSNIPHQQFNAINVSHSFDVSIVPNNIFFERPSNSNHIGNSQCQHFLPCINVIAIGGCQVLTNRNGFHIADQGGLDLMACQTTPPNIPLLEIMVRWGLMEGNQWLMSP